MNSQFSAVAILAPNARFSRMPGGTIMKKLHIENNNKKMAKVLVRSEDVDQAET